MLVRHAVATALSLAVITNAPDLIAKHAPALLENCAPNKTFRTFQQFYPFYLTQHSDEMCRRLHFMGTTLVILLSSMDIGVMTSFLVASAAAVVACASTCSLPHGIVEAVVMVLTLIFVYPSLRLSSKGARLAWLLPVVGYGFAWVGHFFFEQNRPATFIYPAFSLFGDFRMWFEIATGQRAF
jgi:hypothetical protein